MKEALDRASAVTIILVLLILYLSYDVFVGVSKIAVIIIDGSIERRKAADVITAMDAAEKDIFVKAVVLRINSPGGTADAVHEIYYKILKLKATKPVVVSVDDLAGSGGYYLASQTDYIVSKQSSVVGGVGVLAELPEAIEDKNIVTTGPYKQGGDAEETYRAIELLKQDFLQVVKLGRGDKLKLSGAELSSARLYIGYDALDLGLVDEIGGLEDAILKAKNLANVKTYKVVYYATSPTDVSPLFVDWSEISSNTTSSPVFYFLIANTNTEK